MSCAGAWTMTNYWLPAWPGSWLDMHRLALFVPPSWDCPLKAWRKCQSKHLPGYVWILLSSSSFLLRYLPTLLLRPLSCRLWCHKIHAFEGFGGGQGRWLGSMRMKLFVHANTKERGGLLASKVPVVDSTVRNALCLFAACRYFRDS